MTIIATQYDWVVGVDAYARTHTFTLLNCRTGEATDTV